MPCLCAHPVFFCVMKLVEAAAVGLGSRGGAGLFGMITTMGSRLLWKFHPDSFLEVSDGSVDLNSSGDAVYI